MLVPASPTPHVMRRETEVQEDEESCSELLSYLFSHVM